MGKPNDNLGILGDTFLTFQKYDMLSIIYRSSKNLNKNHNNIYIYTAVPPYNAVVGMWVFGSPDKRGHYRTWYSVAGCTVNLTNKYLGQLELQCKL